MLLPYTTLTYYGAAAGAMVDTLATIPPQLSIKGTARANFNITIIPLQPFLKPTRLVNSPLSVQGQGVLFAAIPKAWATPRLNISIGSVPSAYDVAQAVWNTLLPGAFAPATAAAKLNSAGGGSSPQDIAAAVWSEPVRTVKVTEVDAAVKDELVDAVWDEQMGAHVAVGSVGKKLKDGIKTTEFLALK